ncbi:MAG: hypothetical protein DBY17_08630 [Oscillospiraceae bacterium]|nr:MAG: hypothetical protein DBY17_08630 [Oscillospiraceae bacterium]
MKTQKGIAKIVLAVCLAVSLVFSALIVGIDTTWGQVEVKLGKLVSDNGTTVNYKMYIPKTASAQDPAPALLYGVGGGDGVDAGRAFAIEASRRGFVVMSIDVPGNGLSESTSGVVRFDSSNQAVVAQEDPTQCHEMAYEYLTSLPFVDSSRMVTGGHSMGGRYTVQVAQNHQDEVQLQFNVGMNFYGTADLGYDFNFALLIGSSDESALVRTTNHSTMQDIYQSEDLKAVFGLGAGDTLEVGKVYGDFAQGTGRVVYSPHTLHIWEPYSNDIVKAFLTCLDSTMEMPNYIAPDDTVYLAKDYLTITMIAVFAVFVASLACVLLDTETFRSLKLAPRKYYGFKKNSAAWWACAAVLTVLCGYSVIWASMQTGSGDPNFFTRYGTSGFKCIWSLVTGASLLVFVAVWYFAFAKKQGMKLADFGVATGEDNKFHIGYLGKALLLGVTVFAAAMVYFLMFYYFTKSNLQWVVFEIDPIPLQRAGTKFLAMMLWMLPFVLMNSIAQRTVISFEKDSPVSTVKALVLSNVMCTLLLIIIHLVFVGNAFFAYRTIFPDARGYIGGEQVMGIAVGTLIINSVGFFMNKKTNSIWPAVIATLPLVAWFQVTASGMTF